MLSGYSKENGRVVIGAKHDEDFVEMYSGLSDRGLGYHIYAPHRRKGYACEACRAIIGYARDVLGFETLEIETDASNEASVKTALALGFVPRSDQSTGNPSEIHTSSRRIRYVRSL